MFRILQNKHGMCAFSNVGLFVGVTYMGAACELLRNPESLLKFFDGPKIF